MFWLFCAFGRSLDLAFFARPCLKERAERCAGDVRRRALTRPCFQTVRVLALSVLFCFCSLAGWEVLFFALHGFKTGYYGRVLSLESFAGFPWGLRGITSVYVPPFMISSLYVCGARTRQEGGSIGTHPRTHTHGEEDGVYKHPDDTTDTQKFTIGFIYYTPEYFRILFVVLCLIYL